MKKMTALLVLAAVLCLSPAAFGEQKVVISTPDAPPAIGPYSQAVQYGHTVYLAGQLPLDLSGTLVGAGDIVAQTHQIMKNLGAVLAAAGLTFDDVLMATVYITDLANFATFNAEYAKYFTADPPARATVQVPALAKNAMLEVSFIAGK